MNNLIKKMIEYNSLDAKRVNHALKVYAFARSIGLLENVDEKTLSIIEAASILHDIGIRIAEAKYQSTAGAYQEKEGVIIAESMLRGENIDEDVIQRVLYIIGHHHSYDKIDGIDFQILVEADLLVNIYEDRINVLDIQHLKKKYFKTSTGIGYLNSLYIPSK